MVKQPPYLPISQHATNCFRQRSFGRQGGRRELIYPDSQSEWRCSWRPRPRQGGNVKGLFFGMFEEEANKESISYLYLYIM